MKDFQELTKEELLEINGGRITTGSTAGDIILGIAIWTMAFPIAAFAFIGSKISGLFKK